MRLKSFISLLPCAVLLVQAAAFAFETDQYNLPPQPLADIGAEVSRYAEENLRKAVDKINREIADRQNCLSVVDVKVKKAKCDSPDKERRELARLRSENAAAKAVYDLLGAGLPPFTNSGTWMESHRFAAQPARYRTGYRKSIFLTFPTDYVGIGSTVNVYGAEFGTDKIAHFFQQGYDYYEIYNRAIAEGLAPNEAIAKAVEWGKKSERTFYGTLVTGVYSNADLCANYAGMRFYQGLTKEIKIGDETRAAVLILKNGFWTFNENADSRRDFIKPFVSEHFNEALNPSIFTKHFGLRAFVRHTVKKQSCKQWLARRSDFSQADYNKISGNLKLWHGEDYGFTDSRNFITIADTCFAAENQNAENSANPRSEIKENLFWLKF